jgi:hypothetical protein
MSDETEDAVNCLKKAAALAVGTATLAGSMMIAPAPAEAQYRGYDRAYHGPAYGYRPHRRNYGGAIAAGAIGGLALGALAASAARPAYAAPVTVYEDAPVCRTFVDRRVNGWGEVVVRRTRVCD